MVENTCIWELFPFCLIASEEVKVGPQLLCWSHPRKFHQGSNSCRVCSDLRGLIQKYDLYMCCQCFRQDVKKISFITLD
ncbi:40S ribosomal protein S29-like [Meles meles]|uniref:40S ribosomal protein S29-like n=1 Tax=Meles meles TaxID=9662 RepID=UPI001E69DFE3|nr:40S ribosomal protein S29-like [Meles meles]